MAKKISGNPSRQRQRQVRRQQDSNEGLLMQTYATPKQEKVDRSPIIPLNESQKRYISAIKSHTVIFATGPAGTGKTWICAALAAQELESNRIDRIVITRPAVEAGEKLGALPGEIEEKYGPYLEPFRDALNERLGKGTVKYHLEHGNIEAAPLAYMRGRTFKNAFVILDEAQNVTPTQMKMFLTRIGPGCTVIVNGDIAQKDIPGKSGLQDAVEKLSFIPAIKHVRFSAEDVVRSGIVQEIVQAYEQAENPVPERA